MKKFNVNKTRANLFKLDCISTVISGITVILSAFLSSALRVPDASAVMKIIFIASLAIFAKGCMNIKSYFGSKDILYKYL